MKLIFDENLSVKLVERLADVFPNSTHVRMVGLEAALDIDLWKFAAANDFISFQKILTFMV